MASDTRPLLVYTYKERSWEPRRFRFQPLDDMADSFAERRKRVVRAGSWWIAALVGAAFAVPVGQAQPQFNQGFSHAGQAAPANSAENSAYSAAIGQPDPQARVSAIQQFLLQYPNTALRQPAIAQMMLAKRDLRAGGAGSTESQPQPPNQPMDRSMTPPANAGAAAAVPITAPMATPPPAGPPRDSLLQHPPKAAEVTSTPGNLAIKADNSSLSQILQEISKSTGMKVDGLGKDERIFGSYGPGDPREVLLSLLDGFGYNVLMIGNDKGAPRQLTLTQRSAAGPVASSAPARSSREPDDDDIEQEQPQPQPQPEPTQPANQPTLNNSDGSAPRNPAEIQQELLRMRQQQQQTPQQPPQ